jgi:hypothetical protein
MDFARARLKMDHSCAIYAPSFGRFDPSVGSTASLPIH